MDRNRRYSLEDKRNALRLAEEVGVNEAARRLSMPSGTLSQWRWAQRQAARKGKDWPARVEPLDRDVDETPSPAPAPEPSSDKPKRV